MSQATYEMVRENYKRACDTTNPRPDLVFARMLREAIGVSKPLGTGDSGRPYGDYYRRPDGRPTLPKDRKKTTADFNLEAVSEALLGHDWRSIVSTSRLLREEATPIGPSHFINVSAWTAAIGGLVQGSVIEGYEGAEFDLAELFPVRMTSPLFWNGGERLVDIIGPSKPAPKVGVGEAHPDVRMDALWVEAGPLAKYGHKILVARETAVVDITGGQILGKAKDLGYGIRYRENELTLDVLCGQTNNFKLGLTADNGATGYNTYGATVPAGYGTTATLGNDIANPMTDPLTTFNASQEALLGYKHPVTGVPMPMADKLTTLVLPANLQWFATYLTTISQLTLGSNPALPAPQIAGTTFPTGWTTADNPFAGIFKNVIVSQWLFSRHTASVTQTDPDLSPGLGLSVANSRRWYRLDPPRFACRRMAWDVNYQEFNQTGFTMLDQGLIFGAVANIATMVQVTNPWAIQRNRAN